MSEAALINGQPIRRVIISHPSVGTWTASVECIDEPSIPQFCQITQGDSTFQGRVLHTNTYGGHRGLVVTGGRAAWSSVLRSRPYDAPRTLQVVEDLCRELDGQEIGIFVPERARLEHFARNQMRAASVLEAAIGKASWWVSPDGKLNVGTRPKQAYKAYRLEAHDTARSTCELSLDDIKLIPGMTLLEGFTSEQTVVSVDIEVSEAGIHATAALSSAGSAEAMLNAIIDRRIEIQCTQIRKYRVVAMSGNKVDLQIASKANGYPDSASVRQWNGAGTWYDLPPGTEVLVAFIDGDRSQPVIVAYVDKDGAAFVPNQIVFANGTQNVARVGDTVEVFGPGTVVTFTPVTPSATPMTPGVPYLISVDSTPPSPVLAAKGSGVITSGNPKVKA